VLRDPDAVRRTIGLAGQYAAVDELLTGRRTCGCWPGST
jgi:ABC-2 type transport system ATP-binding protein